jgi:glutamate formiminotransferase / 5-formyltetrahydrofolate cyclo-ligase
VFECVINLSEGRDASLLGELSATAGTSLRDLHADSFHNRSVFTLINDADQLTRDVRSLLSASFTSLDLSRHEGVHPRFGVVDVVPFVALAPEEPSGALLLRDATARWIADTFSVPVFLYGLVGDVIRTLPEVRKRAFLSLQPDRGPARASAKLGASAVGARELLVAWNLWLHGVTLQEAREIARTVRRAEVRALAFQVGDRVQVSCNLVSPLVIGPSALFDQVTSLLPARGTIQRAELVGLAPRALLAREDPTRWPELDLSEERTIESRLS